MSTSRVITKLHKKLSLLLFIYSLKLIVFSENGNYLVVYQVYVVVLILEV